MVHNSGTVSSDSKKLDLTSELVSLANDLNAVDPKFRLAKSEGDFGTETEDEAATFLKYDEKRFGRDFELYNFMSKLHGIENSVITLVEELLLPIKNISPVGFTVAITRVKTWKVFGDKQQDWEDMLNSF